MAASLGYKGHMVVYGSLDPTDFNIDGKELMALCKRINAYHVTSMSCDRNIGLPSLKENVEGLLKVFRAGVLDLPVEKEFDFKDFMEGFDYYFNKSSRTGIVLVKIAPE